MSTIKPKINLNSNAKDKIVTPYEQARNALADLTPLTPEEIRVLDSYKISLGSVILTVVQNWDHIEIFIGINALYVKNSLLLFHIPVPYEHAKLGEDVIKSNLVKEIRIIFLRAILNNNLPPGVWRELMEDLKSYYGTSSKFIARYTDIDNSYRIKFPEDDYEILPREEARRLRQMREEQFKVAKGEKQRVASLAKQLAPTTTPPSLHGITSITYNDADFRKDLLETLATINIPRRGG